MEREDNKLKTAKTVTGTGSSSSRRTLGELIVSFFVGVKNSVQNLMAKIMAYSLRGQKDGSVAPGAVREVKHPSQHSAMPAVKGISIGTHERKVAANNTNIITSADTPKVSIPTTTKTKVDTKADNTAAETPSHTGSATNKKPSLQPALPLAQEVMARNLRLTDSGADEAFAALVEEEKKLAIHKEKEAIAEDAKLKTTRVAQELVANKLQAIHKGNEARAVYEELKKERVAQELVANKLQSMYRGFLGRRRAANVARTARPDPNSKRTKRRLKQLAAQARKQGQIVSNEWLSKKGLPAEYASASNKKEHYSTKPKDELKRASTYNVVTNITSFLPALLSFALAFSVDTKEKLQEAKAHNAAKAKRAKQDSRQSRRALERDEKNVALKEYREMQRAALEEKAANLITNKKPSLHSKRKNRGGKAKYKQQRRLDTHMQKSKAKPIKRGNK